MNKLVGKSTTTYQRFDDANAQYYRNLFRKLTAGKSNDDDKVDAVNRYVATKLNYNETQWDLESPRRVLERGSQYCGHLAAALSTVLEVGGYATRQIQLSDDDRPDPCTHVVVEVFYQHEWHLYDPTFGVKFEASDGSVVSYRNLRLNTALIRKDLFPGLKPDARRDLLVWMSDVYNSGYHHFYCLTRK